MLNQNDKLSFLIPVHNEDKVISKTLRECYEKLKSLNINFEIIVINDGSTDTTKEILSQVDYVKVLNNPYNIGYGASLKRGIASSSGNWIMIIDADGTYPISDIDKIIKPAGDYDMVVGNRQHDKDHFGRKPAKWFLKKLASFLAGKKIPDLNSGMRIFKKSVALEFWHLYPSRFSFTSTITLACFANDYFVKYVDIPYYSRVGRSGIKPRNFFDFIALILKLVVYFKPLKMLSPLALLFLLAGLAKLVKDFVVNGYIGTLALLLILFAVQIFIMAIISEVIIKRQK
ncbi:glycosyltransferase family 2 protein [Candidatus Falkowbacteria bacterium]|uniref:Glycosyltransferase family 2 protein n=1 Tax=Candidatus Buchananbacteria bacterium CG10_big_fil_rev_8_21_14_0_10_33_19 TaxID=1974525 RepID=A0A2H0W390_9BACT|nr:glycosyltransferase family 2 protein [Candidatus Falkowbacteria bacterium]PIS05832.1 MAG: glycosyltransferase family 2 protein [Candidatus Buchananbacteria bacterium CG10_big_fil_rev_8_21_14_0_10_33_19]